MTESASELVSSCVQRAQEAAASGTLLRLPFETLFEYLKVSRPASCPFDMVFPWETPMRKEGSMMIASHLLPLSDVWLGEDHCI